MALLKFVATIILFLWVIGNGLGAGQHVANGASWGDALSRQQAAMGQRAAGCGEAIGDFSNNAWKLPAKSREPVSDRMGTHCLKLLVPF